MGVRDDLVLIGWLAELAPETSGCPGAGALATAAIRSRFREQRTLDEALANALRRAAATAVLQLPERVDPVEGQRTILADRRRFFAALSREEPAVVVVAELLDGLGLTRGRPVGPALAPLTLAAFRAQTRDLFPRADMGGRGLAIAVAEQVARTVDAHRRLGIEAEIRALQLGDGQATVDGEAGTLAEADAHAANGDWEGAAHALRGARQRFEAAGNLGGIAAVLRRQASLPQADARVELLQEAARLANAADDRTGETECLEDLAGAYAEAGRERAAVGVLGRIARRARESVDAAGEARALQLAGRLLCEAPAGRDDPGRGLVLLLFAADLAASVDPVVADLIRGYIKGFQYTLSDTQFAAIEPLLERDRQEVVAEVFAGVEGDQGPPG